MTIAIGILAFFVVLAVLILVHELGHFGAAKLVGVRVEEFGLGFPPRLKSWRRGETVYSLNAVPIGGFVKMLGENGDHPQPDSFGAQAHWKRLMILAAGPSMNLLLAIVLSFFVLVGGTPKSTTVITGVAQDSPAASAHLLPGDRIVEVNGTPIKYLEDLQGIVSNNLGRPVSLLVMRGRHIVRTSLVPRADPPPKQGAMGIVLGNYTIVHYGPVDAGRLAVGEVGTMVTSLPSILQAVSQHGGHGVTGPIGIAQITTGVVQDEPKQGIGVLLYFVALLSVNLGVLNLLPIPALDGGRIVFVLASWVRRKNFDPELEGMVHLVGMALLLVLIALISYQDVVRILSGGSF